MADHDAALAREGSQFGQFFGGAPSARVTVEGGVEAGECCSRVRGIVARQFVMYSRPHRPLVGLAAAAAGDGVGNAAVLLAADPARGERRASSETATSVPAALFDAGDRDLGSRAGRQKDADVQDAVLLAADHGLAFHQENHRLGGVAGLQHRNGRLWALLDGHVGEWASGDPR
ncbi:MAG: hypothetical protein F2681_16480 [Actinobacteria bacterium]|nr:hypothetical protein [Actinomycetota bacterium]MSW79038.1 hypothetical protein [Actinomycetota bacterium]MSZ84729.1 hypothetical protein [Actinomycetota bacterium]MTB19406.1 hypothetical protein [Actinomycetota bacterium]